MKQDKQDDKLKTVTAIIQLLTAILSLTNIVLAIIFR